MPTYGILEEYNPQSELWSDYVERCEQYFTANSIGNLGDDMTKRRAILLSVCGAETYAIIQKIGCSRQTL